MLVCLSVEIGKEDGSEIQEIDASSAFPCGRKIGSSHVGDRRESARDRSRPFALSPPLKNILCRYLALFVMHVRITPLIGHITQSNPTLQLLLV